MNSVGGACHEFVQFVDYIQCSFENDLRTRNEPFKLWRCRFTLLKTHSNTEHFPEFNSNPTNMNTNINSNINSNINPNINSNMNSNFNANTNPSRMYQYCASQLLIECDHQKFNDSKFPPKCEMELEVRKCSPSESESNLDGMHFVMSGNVKHLKHPNAFDESQDYSYTAVTAFLSLLFIVFILIVCISTVWTLAIGCKTFVRKIYHKKNVSNSSDPLNPMNPSNLSNPLNPNDPMFPNQSYEPFDPNNPSNPNLNPYYQYYQYYQNVQDDSEIVNSENVKVQTTKNYFTI